MSVSGIFRPFSELSGKMKVLSVQGWTAFAEADQETLEHSPTHHNDQHENDKLTMYTRSRLPNMHKHLCFLSLKSENNNKEKNPLPGGCSAACVAGSSEGACFLH